MAQYVYVLYNHKDKYMYTGYTGNLKQRMQQHRQGKSASTKLHQPMKLVYYECCIAWQDARAREKYLKSGMGKRYIKNRLAQYFAGL